MLKYIFSLARHRGINVEKLSVTMSDILENLDKVSFTITNILTVLSNISTTHGNLINS